MRRATDGSGLLRRNRGNELPPSCGFGPPASTRSEGPTVRFNGSNAAGVQADFNPVGLALARLIPFMASLSAIQNPSLRAKRSNPSRHVKKERVDCSAEPHRARVRATRWLAMTSNPATSSCLVRALSLAWRPATSSRWPARHDDEFKPSWGPGALALSHHFVEKDSGSRPFAAIKKTHS